MTRELKLALIVGFALVLVVTVLISDHLSHARQTKIAALPTDAIKVIEPAPIALDATPEPIAAGPATPALPNTIASMPLIGSGATSEPGPVVISMGSGSTTPGATPSRVTSLDETVRANGGTIKDGVIHMQPAMQNTVTPIPGAGATPTAPVLVNKPAAKGTETGPFATPTTPAKPGIGSMPLPISNDPTHVVADGENYFKITKQYYGDGKLWRKLVKYNNLAESNPLKVGQKIKVPSKDVLLGKAVLAGSTPVIPSALINSLPGTQANDRVVPVRPSNAIALTGSGAKPSATPATPGTTKTHTYTVKKGDTLADIARRELGSSKRGSEIASLNPKTIKDSDNVPLGAVLTIPN